MRYLFEIDKEKAPAIEKALSVLEKNLIRTLDACAFGIILFDSNGDCLTLNDRWRQLYHLDYNGMKDYNMLNDPVVQTKHIWDAIRNSFEGECGVIDDNYFTPEEWDKPGRGRWTRGYAIPIFPRNSPSEKQIGSALILEDVTEAKLVKAEVRRLTSIIEEIKSTQQSLCNGLSDLKAGDEVVERTSPASYGRMDRRQSKRINIPRREREIFEMLASGRSVKEIAEHLNLGAKSIYTYRARLLKRLNLSCDVELALAWREMND